MTKAGRKPKDDSGIPYKTKAVRMPLEMEREIERRRLELKKEVPAGVTINTSDVVRELLSKALKGELIEIPDDLREEIQTFRRKLQEQIPKELPITVTFQQTLEVLLKKALKK